MSSEFVSTKNYRKIKSSAFFLDFVRITGAIPGLLITRPKVLYAGDKKKSRVKKGVLIASNHITFIDPILLYCVFWRRRLNFLATKNLYKNKIFAWMITAVGCIQVDKDDISMRSMHETIDRLKAGKAILIFPEGQVNTQGEPMKFKSGVALMAKLGNVPIQPIYIAREPQRFARYHVVIGEPVDISQMCGRFPTVDELQKIGDHIRDKELELEQFYQNYRDKKKK